MKMTILFVQGGGGYAVHDAWHNKLEVEAAWHPVADLARTGAEPAGYRGSFEI